MIADKGYHTDATLAALKSVAVRSYPSEQDRGRHRRQDKKTACVVCQSPPHRRAAAFATSAEPVALVARPLTHIFVQVQFFTNH